MNVIYQELTLDLIQQRPWIEVRVKRYDDKIRHLLITLTNDSLPYTIQNGVLVRFQGKKADDTQFQRDCVVTSENKIDVELTEQVLACDGPILAEIELSDNSGVLSTANFVLIVQEEALPRSDIISSDDYQSIDKIKADTLQYKKDAEAAKAAAEAAKEAAAGSANTANQQAQTAQLEAEKVQKIVAGNEAYTKTESDLKYTVAPRKEASSDTGELKLTDADDGLSYLELQGNSEQYTATGTNLFDVKQLVKNMQGLNSKYITIGKDGDGEFMNILNNAWNRLRCLEFTNDPTKSYRIGCKARYSSGNGNVLLFAVMYKDGTYTASSQIAGQTKYTEMSAIIPAGKEVDYFYFSYSSVGSYYDVLLDSFYLYPEDAPSDEKPTGGYGTPSPEYSSEVRSVGDIPKDVNGVEIRNLLDEEWIKNQPESAWVKAVSGSNTQFKLRLGDGMKRAVRATAFGRTPIAGGKSFSVTLGDQAGGSGIPLVYNNVIGTGTADYTTVEYVNLYITVNGTTTATHSQMLEVFNYFNSMVTSAAEIDEYRPYIGENNGLVKMESTGKNLTGNSEIIGQATNAGVTVTMNEDQTFNISGTLTADYYNFYRNRLVPLDAGETYTITSNLNSPNLNIVLQKVDKNNNAESSTWVVLKKGQNKVTTTFNGENLKGCNIVIQPITQGSSYDERNIYVQIEKGNAQTEYQPYHQQITWIPLKEPLRKIEDYADSIDKKGNVIQKIGEFIIDNTYTIIKNGSNVNEWLYYCVFGENLTYGAKAISNIFPPGTSYVSSAKGEYLIGSLPLYRGLYFNVSKYVDINTPDAVKQWLIEQNCVIYAQIADAKQIGYQIPAVYIETYDQETNIRCLNKVKPSDMTLDYKIAMSSLIKRLEALEAKTVQEV